MAEAFGFDLAKGLLSKLLSLAAEEVILAWGLEDELNSLKERLRLVHTLLSYAETKPTIPVEPVQLWLNMLSGAARDADALFDELVYEAIRQKVENRKLAKTTSNCLRFCTSLEELSIRTCELLVSVPDLRHLTRLTRLQIGPLCPDLDYFPWPYPYTSVMMLTLYGWPKLKSLPEQLQYLSTSLTRLEISEFDGLETLPDWLGNLSNLQSLYISHCKNLMNMPSVEAMHCLRKLNQLKIRFCPLLAERCTKESGSEWYKISHVPEIEIDGESVQSSN